MATLWHTVATKDVRLLKSQMDQVNALPKEYSFLNYLRCHDDIGWGLDYGRLREWGMEEVPHKQFLNDYFLGNFPGSTSSGELYNFDPVTRDARFCGTTASMCGIEKGDASGVKLDLMLHAFLLFQSGIPVIYSGDEVAACNDWSYHKDPHKAEDSRYIHRGAFDWTKVEEIEKSGTVVSEIFHGLAELETAREKDSIFDSDANVYTIETHNASVLGMVRIRGEEWMIGLFNFSNQEESVWIVEMQERYRNVLTGKVTDQAVFTMGAHDYLWLKKLF
jgi:amylosucrase